MDQLAAGCTVKMSDSSSSSSGGKSGTIPELSVYVGNLDSDTALAKMEELLYELFLQVRSSACYGACIEICGEQRATP